MICKLIEKNGFVEDINIFKKDDYIEIILNIKDTTNISNFIVIKCEDISTIINLLTIMNVDSITSVAGTYVRLVTDNTTNKIVKIKHIFENKGININE